ncbi:MAG TPA: acetate--CoA ligase family protein, partial [Longimicrobium sp.]|nr:acetate--CoA ligase family protein [Longimicrobium sp.]
VPPLGIRQEDVAEAIVDVAGGRRDKPVLAVLMGREGLPQGLAELNAAGIPGYRFPESAVRALAAMYRQGVWQRRPAGEVQEFAVDRGAVDGIIARAAEEGREKLTETEVMRVLEAYGIPVAPYTIAKTLDEAEAAAERLGFPVVLKVLSPKIIHKSDVGGVVVGVEDGAELAKAWVQLTQDVPRRAGITADELEGVLVQQMVKGGKETIVGMTSDPQFGPVLMFGLGGIYVEALQDVVFRVHPVSDVDAQEMVRAIRGRRLLEGVRGEPASDLDAAAGVVQRVSQLVGDHPQIREMDVNPWLAFPEGGVAVDGRISIRAGDAHG